MNKKLTPKPVLSNWVFSALGKKVRAYYMFLN